MNISQLNVIKTRFTKNVDRCANQHANIRKKYFAEINVDQAAIAIKDLLEESMENVLNRKLVLKVCDIK